MLVAFAALACAAAPGASRMPAIAPGVAVLAVPVAGLTSEPARLRLEHEFSRSIPVAARHAALVGLAGATRRERRDRRRGVGCARRTARRTCAAARRVVKEGRAQVRRARCGRVDRDAVDATLVRVSGAGPLIREAKPGIAVRQVALRRALEQRLRNGTRTPIVLPTRAVKAKVTKAKFGPVIWIDRRTNTLRLYKSTKPVRTLRRRDRPRAVPDAVRALLDRRHAVQPVVAPARLTLGARA